MLFQYKGYEGSALYSETDKVWHGKITNITDLVTYKNNTLISLEFSFQEAVEDYIELCKLLKDGKSKV